MGDNMKDKFRFANTYEQRITLKCMEGFCEEKRRGIIMKSVMYGAIAAFVVIFLGGLIGATTAKTTKGFSGGRPKFENYEDTILGEVYEYVNVQVDHTNSSVSSAYSGANTSKGYYKLVKEPSEIDFDRYEFSNSYNKDKKYLSSKTRQTGKYKDAPDYLRVVKEAKQYFDANIDKRINRARMSSTGAIVGGIVLIVLYILCAFAWIKGCIKENKSRVKLVEDGTFSVIKAKLIGREENSHYRSATTYRIEVQFEDGEKLALDTSQSQYEAFESGATCYVVKLNDEYGFYDKYDIVWEELCGANTIL